MAGWECQSSAASGGPTRGSRRTQLALQGVVNYTNKETRWWPRFGDILKTRRYAAPRQASIDKPHSQVLSKKNATLASAQARRPCKTTTGCRRRPSNKGIARGSRARGGGLPRRPGGGPRRGRLLESRTPHAFYEAGGPFRRPGPSVVRAARKRGGGRREVPSRGTAPHHRGSGAAARTPPRALRASRSPPG